MYYLPKGHAMKILDVLNSPWAIIPDKLAEITEIYGRHVRGEKIDIAAIEAQIGQPLNSRPKGYEVQYGGVALLPVDGVLSKRMNFFTKISGGTSMQYLTRDLRQALAEPQVRSVVLVVDSPGGTVDGTVEAARAVMEARGGDKPVVAWVDGLMASAAYWIGSAADAIYLGAETDEVGSIGVAMQHVDYSGNDARWGIKRTDIYAGKYKRIASDTGPLSEEGLAYLQAQVDYYYSLFVEAVAQQRGAAVEQVLSDMADGRLFIGKQAIKAGLVDGASTLEALVADLAAGTYGRMRSGVAGAASPRQETGAGAAPEDPQPEPMEQAMTREELEKNHPELVKALRDEGFAAGASAERQRIKDVEAQALPGHDKLITELKFDGKTTGPEAATRVLAAENAKLAGIRNDLNADAPKPAAASPSATGEHPDPDADAGLPLEERCKRKWDKDAKLRAEYGDNYADYLAFEKADAAGRVKILRGKQAA